MQRAQREEEEKIIRDVLDKPSSTKKQPMATIFLDREFPPEQAIEIEVVEQVEEVKDPEEEVQQSGDRLASVGEAKEESAIETPSRRLNLLSAIDMMNEI